MKHVKLFAPFLMFVFHSSCGQNQTNSPKDNISIGHYSEPQLKENSAGNPAVRLAATSSVPVSIVRNVKQARNGDILIASHLGVFRYDARLSARAGTDGNDEVGQGKTITDFKDKESQK